MKLIQNISCKVRFAMSRLPRFPVTYRLVDVNSKVIEIAWSKIMPFFDREQSFFNFDLWGWDVPELRFLNKFLLPGMIFLDVGAYHGLYSIVASKKVLVSGKIYAFEPNPVDAQRIKHHIRINGSHNITVELLALSDNDDGAEFYIPTSGVMTVGSLRPSEISRGELKSVTVQTIRLDQYVKEKQIEQIDLIKVDVEGAEMLFLDGACETLQHFQPLLIVEAIDVVCQAWGYSGADLLKRVQNELGYKLYAFDAWGYLTPHQIYENYPLDSKCNFLAVPPSKIHIIENLITEKPVSVA